MSLSGVVLLRVDMDAVVRKRRPCVKVCACAKVCRGVLECSAMYIDNTPPLPRTISPTSLAVMSPSNQGSSFLLQWSVCRTMGTP